MHSGGNTKARQASCAAPTAARPRPPMAAGRPGCATGLPRAGAPRPGATGAEARGERAETETDLIVRGAARGARQTVTRDVAREGRAGVAVETGKPFEQHAAEDLPVVGDWLAGQLFGTAKNAAAGRGARRGGEETGRSRTRRAGGTHRRDAGPAIAGGLSPRASGVGAPRRRAGRRRRRISSTKSIRPPLPESR